MKKIKAKDKCLIKERQHCLNCPSIKECKVKAGEWRGYHYGLDKMKVVMPEDLKEFYEKEFRFIPDRVKKKEGNKDIS